MNTLKNNINPFEISSGSMRVANLSFLLILMIFLTVFGIIIINNEVLGIGLCLGLLAIVILIYTIFNRPKSGIYLLIVVGFFAIGASRYIQLPWGLTIDALLVLIYIALFFKGFAKKLPWIKVESGLTVLVSLWMVYIILQLANPEVISIKAWFYAMRGVGLYQFLAIPLLFMLFNRQKDLNNFFVIWGILSLIGSLKGFIQFYFGVDPFEQRWLDQGGAETHILFGKLRIFSFYSDAGQFGASQAHAAVVFGILTLFLKSSLKQKTFFALVALAGLFGMIISGTRGAIAVPAIGGFMFLILSKNIKVLLLGALLGLGVYIFFVHTTIGQGNAEIRRMRTAFDPNEASLQVRLSNQRKIKDYLSTRPFGGGVGATGNWGKRFTPQSYLANTATDSWYVMIWADTGIVGLIYYLLMLFFILFIGARNVMFKITNNDLRIQIMAITCGMAGIMMASYGNGVFGQMPTGILMYITMVFIFISPELDKNVTLKRLKK